MLPSAEQRHCARMSVGFGITRAQSLGFKAQGGRDKKQLGTNHLTDMHQTELFYPTPPLTVLPLSIVLGRQYTLNAQPGDLLNPNCTPSKLLDPNRTTLYVHPLKKKEAVWSHMEIMNMVCHSFIHNPYLSQQSPPLLIHFISKHRTSR